MKIDSRTKVYGLFGYPVKHTFSPLMHNAAFEELCINSLYLAFEIKPTQLGEAIRAIGSLGLGGVNLTIPHKEAALAYLDELSPEARLIGAVNTVVVRDGKLLGHNTDGFGFVASLKKDGRWKPQEKSVFILGSGGAGKAIAVELAKAGVRLVTLADLIPERAKAIALNINRNFSRCKVRVCSLNKKAMAKYMGSSDLFVNATPQGMRPRDRLPIDPSCLHQHLMVYDLIYNPLETKLINYARSHGLKAFNGLGMLLYQGAASFKLWTGRKAPVEVMRKALVSEIKGGRI